MKTQIRRIIETEMAFGPMNTFADRLEQALVGRINAYCDSVRTSSHLLGEDLASRMIAIIQSGIIGSDSDS